MHEESKRRVEARDRQKERERKEADEFTKSLLGTKKSTKPPGDSSKSTGTTKRPTIAELITMTTRNSEKIKQLTGENGDLKKAKTALQHEKEALVQANETLTDEVSKSKEAIQGLTEANKKYSKDQQEYVQQKERILAVNRDLVSQNKECKKRITELETKIVETQGNSVSTVAPTDGVPREEYEGIVRDKEALEQAHETLGEENAALKKENARLLKLTKELEGRLNKALSCLKTEGNFSPDEVSRAVVTEIEKFVKKEGYRDWKFVRSSASIAKFMKEVYEAVGKSMPSILDSNDADNYCDWIDFRRIYTKTSIKVLRDRLQYSQTRMKDALVRKLTERWCQVESA